MDSFFHLCKGLLAECLAVLNLFSRQPSTRVARGQKGDKNSGRVVRRGADARSIRSCRSCRFLPLLAKALAHLPEGLNQ